MQLQLIFCCCSFVMRFCLFSDHLFHLPLNQTISLHFVIRLLFFHQQEDPLSGKNCNLSVSHLKPPAAPKLLQNSCSKSLDPKVWRTYFSIFLLNSDHTLVNLSQSLKHGSTDRKFSFFFPKKTDWLKKWESRSVGDTMRNKSWESRRAGRSFTSTSCILLQDSALIFEWKEWEDEMRLLCSSYSWKKHTQSLVVQERLIRLPETSEVSWRTLLFRRPLCSIEHELMWSLRKLVWSACCSFLWR